jgi:hypothetical protein
MSITPQISSRAAADDLLSALADQLGSAGATYDLVVVGGSALLALGLISRPTQDVDVVALTGARGLLSADPLPDALIQARDRVARDFALPLTWLNSGPTALLDFGLPDGFEGRVSIRDYGPSLRVRFASRFDQVHLKLYALVDQGPGKHEADLRALDPTPKELLAAALWSRTHDPSAGHRELLAAALAHLGVHDADLGP